MMKKDWSNTYLFVLLGIPLLIFGIWVNWWLAIIMFFIWCYFLLYRLYEGWKDAKLMNEWNKTDEQRLNEKRYKTLKKIL